MPEGAASPPDRALPPSSEAVGDDVRIRSNLTFPNPDDPPTLRFERCGDLSITLDIPSQLGDPAVAILGSELRLHRLKATTTPFLGIPVPEIAVHENGDAPGSVRYVRFASHTAGMDSVSKPASVQRLSQKPLRPGVTTSHRSHDA